MKIRPATGRVFTERKCPPIVRATAVARAALANSAGIRSASYQRRTTRNRALAGVVSLTPSRTARTRNR